MVYGTDSVQCHHNKYSMVVKKIVIDEKITKRWRFNMNVMDIIGIHPNLHHLHHVLCLLDLVGNNPDTTEAV